MKHNESNTIYKNKNVLKQSLRINRMHNKAMHEIIVDITTMTYSFILKMHTERPQIMNSINIYRRIMECLREQWTDKSRIV